MMLSVFGFACPSNHVFSLMTHCFNFLFSPRLADILMMNLFALTPEAGVI
jgi:TnpA family transposase